MPKHTIQQYLYVALSVVFLLASTWTLFDAITFTPTDAQCVENMSSWSPAREAIKYEWEMFASIGFLVHSEYFDAAIPEREAAWENLLPKNPITIPKSHLKDLHLPQTSPWIHANHKKDSILALPEVFVQLECLNLIRRHAQADETNNTHLPSFQGPEDHIYQRLEQCFDRLRTSFLCWSDIVPVLQEFTDDRLHSHVVKYDFGTRHKCRDFGAIREWTVRNEGDYEMVDAWWGGLEED